MKKTIYSGAMASALAAGVSTFSGGSLAAPAAAPKAAKVSVVQRVAALEVLNVSCVTCAPIVKRALSVVPGVKQVQVKEGGATAKVRVVYDPRKVTPAALAKAATNAGYPAKVVAK
jgi:mercuric ion binding protein